MPAVSHSKLEWESHLEVEMFATLRAHSFPAALSAALVALVTVAAALPLVGLARTLPALEQQLPIAVQRAAVQGVALANAPLPR